MSLRVALQTLLVFVLGLPLLQMTLWWIEQLLAALGDTAAAGVLGYVSVAVRILWLACLVGLLVVLSLDALSHTGPLEKPFDEDEERFTE